MSETLFKLVSAVAASGAPLLTPIGGSLRTKLTLRRDLPWPAPRGSLDLLGRPSPK